MLMPLTAQQLIDSFPLPLRVLWCCPQEKVYSRSEVAIVNEEAMQQAGYAPGMGLLQAPQAQQDLWQQQDQQQAAVAAQDDVAGIRRAKRHGALGSEHSLKHKHAAVSLGLGVSLFCYSDATGEWVHRAVGSGVRVQPQAQARGGEPWSRCFTQCFIVVVGSSKVG